jgi:uncharacterized membrane protein YheB (UPF0754 family)
LQNNKIFTLKSYKSAITNIIAIIVIIFGLFIDTKYSEIILNIGFFAFSAAITNWLAVYMLFDKIPFIYGSGVVERRFFEFKNAVKNLILTQFFTKKNINKFINKQKFSFNAESLKQKIDFDKIFNDLVDAILSSSLGGMINMVGGKDALTPIKEPVILKLQEIMGNIIKDVNNLEDKNLLIDKLHQEITLIIDHRLAELTPSQVKLIIQDMIKEHLGWLVVWGGVFGAIIGFILGIIV